MCLAVIALAAHPAYTLVLAANRDEFHSRPTASAGWWKEGWLAGRDLAAGGTWLGVTRRGRWAFVTNVREPGRFDSAAPSRGELVPLLLSDARDPMDALVALQAQGPRYNGYNVIVGDRGHAAWASNRAPAPQALPSGVAGVSNALLDTPWPKLARSKAALAAWVAQGGSDVEALFAALADRTLAPDADLPATGVTQERERMLSAPFIVSPVYGTRCSTIVTVAHDGDARFVERSFNAAGELTGEVDQRFSVVA